MRHSGAFRGDPAAARPLRIGHPASTYPYLRNVVGRVPGARYVEVRNACALLARVARVGRRLRVCRGPMWEPQNLQFSFRDLPGPGAADVLHFFNLVSFGARPWISSFETVLPRFRPTLAPRVGREASWVSAVPAPEVQRALDAMAGPACRGLLALSRCNLEMQRELLSHAAPAQAEAIERKLRVLYPPQARLVESFAAKGLALAGPIRFVFVGASFHRKGGREVLEVLGRLRREGLDCRLTLVSSIALDPYASGETAEDIAEARARIAANRDWIAHHERLPNDEVLRLMREAHVGLLPTYADTFGYSVLEMQAAGCPVITTGVRALPEINSERTGWMIEVPTNRLGESLHCTAAQRQELSRRIAEGLERAVRGIFRDREAVARKADAALAQLRAQHDPADYAERLHALYCEAAR